MTRRELRDLRALLGRCKHCGIQLRAHELGVIFFCDDCRDARAESQATYRATAKGKRQAREQMRRSYWRNPSIRIQRVGADRDALIAHGLCTYCRKEDALPGRRYGEKCRMVRAKVHRSGVTRMTVCGAEHRWGPEQIAASDDPEFVNCGRCLKIAPFSKLKAAA